MPIPKTAALNRTFIRNDVYRSLLEWIVEGELVPGEKLKDQELAAQLGVSRTPVREALRKLEDEGLVETSANRWTRVAPIDIQDAESIYPIMQKLEELALTLAFPGLSAQHIQEMKAANKSLKQALENKDSRAAVLADCTFHQVIIEAADNLELSSILDQIKVKYSRIELAYFSRADLLMASYEEHQRLVSALKERDLAAASSALTSNWQASIERLRDAGERL